MTLSPRVRAGRTPTDGRLGHDVLVHAEEVSWVVLPLLGACSHVIEGRVVAPRALGPVLSAPAHLYRAATTSLEFMSMVMVHPEVPRNSNGSGLGPRRKAVISTGRMLNPSFRVDAK